MNGYNNKIEELLEHLHTNNASGLTSEQVLKNREQYGENKLEEKGGESLFHMIMGELLQFLNILLILAAFISAFCLE